MILDIIKTLPSGGGYSRGSSFQSPTITAHNIGADRWEMRVYDGFPSHCTGATYAVFARLIAVLQDNGRIALDGEQIAALSAKSRMPDGATLVDGQGPFQIFNSNGAGVAALLKHTGTGMSFRDDKLLYARAGDFLKLFWNDNVGASEQGHQVIYLGRKTVGSREMVCFWGSQRQNKKKRPGGTEALYFPAAEGDKVVDGYGEACRPRDDIKAMVFSRVTCMEHLAAGLDDMRAKALADPRRAVPIRRRVSLQAAQHLVRSGDARSHVRHPRGAEHLRQSRARRAVRLARLRRQGGVDRLAVAHEFGMRHDASLERRVDGVEVDVGDEAVDAGVDAGRRGAVHIAVRA